MVADLFEGGPVGGPQGQTPLDQLLALWMRENRKTLKIPFIVDIFWIVLYPLLKLEGDREL